MQTARETVPRIPCEVTYKCGCTRCGIQAELPQLCPVHGQPSIQLALIPRWRESGQ